MAIRVAINGFGRIGRLVLRSIVESGRRDVEVVSINDLGPVATNAHLLRYDSVHGRFPASVTVEGDMIIAAGHKIKVTAIKDPTTLPHKELDVDIVLECTGIFTARAKAAAHLEAGAKRVIVAAPSDGADLTVVYGVNHEKLTKQHIVISNASCTTNCLAPVAFVLNNAVGIEKGIMTTIHSYTNDQPVLDQLHKDLYRARAAALSMIPTTTGAAKAVGLVIPELKGKLDGFRRARADTERLAGRSEIHLQEADHQRRNQRSDQSCGGRPAQGHPRRRRGAAGFDRLQSQSGVVLFRARPDQGARRQSRQRDELVRQRMGLLQPHGRHGRVDGQVDLSIAEGRCRKAAPFVCPLFAAPPARERGTQDKSHGKIPHTRRSRRQR